MTTQTLAALSPEISLLVVATAVYFLGAFWTRDRLWAWLSLAGLAVAGCLLASLPARGHLGPVQIDGLSQFIRWLALASGAGLFGMILRGGATRNPAEYSGSLLLCIAGLMLVAVADELVLLFVSLELISIPTYLLLYLGRHDSASREATAKYFYLSILASAILLYGFSFLYGATGTTELSAMRARWLGEPVVAPGLLARLAAILIFAGLGFRIAAVPFHFYAPDVYQGTSAVNAAMLSVVPKAAGLVVLLRIIVVAMPTLQPHAWQIAMGLAVLTMTLGNVIALWQDNLRRLLAYSSIAHAGYLLLGVTVAAGASRTTAWNGAGTVLFYLAVYSIATLGMFAALDYLARRDRQVDVIDELAGLGRTRPVVAGSMTLFLFSLTGIPPLAGFWGKYVVFGGALTVEAASGAADATQGWFVIAAVIGVLNAAISAAYYLRVIAVIGFRTPLAVPRGEDTRAAGLVMLICAFGVLLLGLFSGPLLDASMRVGAALMTGP